MLDGVYKLPVQSMKILAGIWFLVFLVLLPCLAGTAYQPDTSQARQPGQRRGALKLPLKDPRIVVIKNKRQLKLYSAGSLVRTYKIGLGLNPVDGAFKFEVQL
jgi:hypothetical protein